jgi:outer membrane protein assembly factor BamE
MIIISLMYVKNILIAFCRITALAASVALLPACEHHILPEPHKINIEQGNSITQEEFELLYTGMSQNEVVEAIGAPMLVDPFHADRWDYIYRLKPGKGRERESHFTLYFRDGVLVKIDSENYKEY